LLFVCCADQNEPYSFSVPIFGPGVVYDVPQPMRVQQLKFLRKSLSLSNLKNYVPLVVDEAEQFFGKWPDEGVVDIREEFSKLIILTASRCLMGPEIREHLFEQVASIFQTLDEGLLPISVFFPYLPIPAHRRRDAARLQMVELFSQVMRERRASPGVPHNDVLQMFMDANYKTLDGDRPLTESEIAGLMIALLFAGQHTSSITASWTGLCLLANRERFLQPVLDENRQRLDDNGGVIDFATLNKMDHLNRAMKEALRMYPPLIFVMRKLLADVEFGDYVIPENDYVFVSPSISMRDPAAFTNPNQYDPDRFAPGREEDRKQPFTFIGFGGGRHSCMGESFAYLQVKTIWAVLFRDFDLELEGDLPLPDYAAMVVGPTAPANIRFRRRQK
jgi:sterol 14alpha-demethylase